MHDLLATRRGRLAAFFLLYLTEGIPYGFTAVALVAQMRRQGLSPAQIGTFVATLYLPWSWKWAMGPVVDLVYSDRLGRRRGWIVGAQVMMAATLLAAWPVDFATHLTAFTCIILVHNCFAATQDVAIDALAVATLPPDERGVANGLMFAGSYTGSAVGGSGALFLASFIGFGNMFPFVAVAILLVTTFVTLRLRERKAPAAPSSDETGVADAQGRSRVGGYLIGTLRAMFGSRTAIVGFCFAVLPAGAMSLSLLLQSSFAVEFGLSDRKIASLALASTVISAVGCVAGGWISDRLGRRAALAAFIAAMAIPTVLFGLYLHRYGWVMPIDPTAPDRPTPSAGLVAALWAAALVYSLFHGLMYGARAAFYMDLCDPKVGATQFTAYMAVLNLVIAYSAFWLGRSAERFGYPITLLIDAAFGCVGLLLLPWCRRAGPKDDPAAPAATTTADPVRHVEPV